MRPAGAVMNHPTTIATRPDATHPRNQAQRMRTPGGWVSGAVTSAGSVVTVPGWVRDPRASNAGSGGGGLDAVLPARQVLRREIADRLEAKGSYAGIRAKC